MEKFSYLVTSNYVSVMNGETGLVTKIMASEDVYARAVAFAKAGDFESIEKLTVKGAVTSFAAKSEGTDFVVRLADGEVKYSFKGGEEKSLHNAMTERVIRMAQEGFDVTPLVNFMSNLMSNPSKTAIDEAFLFIEAMGTPITSDGHFIAYKIVRDNYRSIHDPEFKNDVGTVVEMPRNEVCDDRNKTCSEGLHFCSKEYLNKYGSGDRDSDRLVLVKINPADIVSIPSDYNNAKGRASKYLIWKDITEAGWQTKFSQKDYTDAPVVDTNPVADEDWVEVDEDLSSWDAINAPIVDQFVTSKVVCPDCGRSEVHKKGMSFLADGTTKQRYKCQACGHPFSKVI